MGVAFFRATIPFNLRSSFSIKSPKPFDGFPSKVLEAFFEKDLTNSFGLIIHAREDGPEEYREDIGREGHHLDGPSLPLLPKYHPF
jgi:hypothetical protein